MTKRALYEADLWPTAANLWDMVPFSFVADWLGPTGEEFEYQEKVGYMRTLPILRTFVVQRRLLVSNSFGTLVSKESLCILSINDSVLPLHLLHH
jgi:hypothetical protein